MRKLEVHTNKILKLTNAVCYMLEDNDFLSLDKTVYQMENYIKSKGAMPIGPLIQCTEVQNDGGAEPKIQISLIRQVNTFINKLEAPYTIQSVLRVPNCLYIRFIGDESHIKFAYDKLNVFAYEQEIPLTGRTYTIFTSKSEDEFSADIFMEKAYTGPI